jgi:hypothetical protein
MGDYKKLGQELVEPAAHSMRIRIRKIACSG